MVVVTIIAAGLLAIAPAEIEPTPTHLRQAIDRAIPLLQKSLEEYARRRDCFSCHHQAVPVIALRLAKSNGFAITDETLRAPAEHAENDLHSAIESYRKGDGQGGGVTRAGYALWMLEASGWDADQTTTAVTQYLLKRDANEGPWRGSSNRPPSEASMFTSTFVAIRALRAYGAADRKAEIDARIAKAKHWLLQARPKDTEDRVFRLLALKAANGPDASIQRAARELLQTQSPDGGWAQLDGQEPDAYATGSAIFALRTGAGIATDAPEIRSGLAFLLRTQRDDGSWYVPTRSKAFQPYFESGFPYGKDQFISMAASSWAVAALVSGGAAAFK
jgi:N-acyl-D-amino-acid deacylase